MHQHFPPLLPFKLISSLVRIPAVKTGQLGLGLELGQVDQVNLEPSQASLHIGSSDQFGTQPINSTELGWIMTWTNQVSYVNVCDFVD